MVMYQYKTKYLNANNWCGADLFLNSGKDMDIKMG